MELLQSVALEVRAGLVQRDAARAGAVLHQGRALIAVREPRLRREQLLGVWYAKLSAGAGAAAGLTAFLALVQLDQHGEPHGGREGTRGAEAPELAVGGLRDERVGGAFLRM